jgi:dephospho-CoA kinase
VTGGIGSGKSVVCSLFSRLGRTVISADEIARNLTESDPTVRASIGKAFGQDLYRPDGSLDRRRLASIVFESAEALERLNSIVHPRVFKEIDRQLALLTVEKRRPYVVVEAALVFESGLDRKLDRVIVVDAIEETRISRVMERDGSSRQEVVARMSSQMSPEEKRKRADFVIQNDQTLQQLGEKVLFLDALLALI